MCTPRVGAASVRVFRIETTQNVLRICGWCFREQMVDVVDVSDCVLLRT